MLTAIGSIWAALTAQSVPDSARQPATPWSCRRVARKCGNRRRNYRSGGIDPIARALLVIEEPESAQLGQRTTASPPKTFCNVRVFPAIKEELIRVQSIVAMRPVGFPMEILLAGFDYQSQRAAAFASL
jgi:hypothetical protein